MVVAGTIHTVGKQVNKEEEILKSESMGVGTVDAVSDN